MTPPIPESTRSDRSTSALHTPEQTPEALAHACAQAMWERDAAARALGIEIAQMRPGHATLQMRVRPDMLNGHHMCHGGFIFALADTAFAYACNSHNLNTVASGCSIDFLAPGHGHDVLEAVAEERALMGRTGVYDVTVRVLTGHSVGKTIALFRGKSHRIQGEVIQGNGVSHDTNRT